MKKFLHINTKTLEDFEVTNVKSLWEKVKGEYQGLSVDVETLYTKSAEDSKIFDVIFSTADEDRHGDIVMQDFDLKFFKKNPVFLDSHNYNSIEHIIGKVKNPSTESGKLKGQVEFAMMNPKGVLAEAMASAGFLNATSIGFIPKLFDDAGNIVKSELLEISAVSVPANARALFEKMADEVTKDIEDMTKKLEDETEEVPVEVVIETKVNIDTKKVLMNNILKAINEMQKENFEEKKRNILKAVRSL